MGRNRRRQIAMSEDEVRQFLGEQLTAMVATIGPQGFPHVVPMWYSLVDGLVHTWTYRTSQKAVNLTRDPRASVLVEDGDTYDQLRGVMIVGHAEVVDDLEDVARFRSSLSARTQGRVPDESAAGSNTEKRVTHRYLPERIISWDHRLLGGRH